MFLRKKSRLRLAVLLLTTFTVSVFMATAFLTRVQAGSIGRSPQNSVTPTIESCGPETLQTGQPQNLFQLNDFVGAYGSGFPSGESFNIYIVNDVGIWSGGMQIPARVPGTGDTVTSNANGDIPHTPLWNYPPSGQLTPGKYDIVVDVNGNGYFDVGIDALDSGDIEVGAGFFVIPEYFLGAILGLAGCFAAFGVFRITKRKNM